jgi:hypothetical protein
MAAVKYRKTPLILVDSYDDPMDYKMGSSARTVAVPSSHMPHETVSNGAQSISDDMTIPTITYQLAVNEATSHYGRANTVKTNTFDHTALESGGNRVGNMQPLSSTTKKPRTLDRLKSLLDPSSKPHGIKEVSSAGCAKRYEVVPLIQSTLAWSKSDPRTGQSTIYRAQPCLYIVNVRGDLYETRGSWKWEVTTPDGRLINDTTTSDSLRKDLTASQSLDFGLLQSRSGDTARRLYEQHSDDGGSLKNAMRYLSTTKSFERLSEAGNVLPYWLHRTQIWDRNGRS